MKRTIVPALLFGAAMVASSAVAIAGDHQTPEAPAEYLEMTSPFSVDDADEKFLKKASRVYKSKCKKCHGEEGDGQGEAAGSMVLKPTDFTAAGYLEGRKDGQLFWITKYGSKDTEMKAFGVGSDAGLPDEELWKVLTYIRSAFTQ